LTSSKQAYKIKPSKTAKGTPITNPIIKKTVITFCTSNVTPDSTAQAAHHATAHVQQANLNAENPHTT